MVGGLTASPPSRFDQYSGWFPPKGCACPRAGSDRVSSWVPGCPRPTQRLPAGSLPPMRNRPPHYVKAEDKSLRARPCSHSAGSSFLECVESSRGMILECWSVDLMTMKRPFRGSLLTLPRKCDRAEFADQLCGGQWQCQFPGRCERAIACRREPDASSLRIDALGCHEDACSPSSGGAPISLRG